MIYFSFKIKSTTNLVTISYQIFNSKPRLWWLMWRCNTSSKRWISQKKDPNKSGRSVPNSSPTKLSSSNITMNPLIIKEKRSHCGKAIDRTNNLEKRLKSSEKALKHHAKQKLCQATLDGSTSSKNGPSPPKKLMVKEMQVVCAPVTCWILEDTSNSRVRLQVHGSHLQEEQKDVIHNVRSIIEG